MLQRQLALKFKNLSQSEHFLLRKKNWFKLKIDRSSSSNIDIPLAKIKKRLSWKLLCPCWIQLVEQSWLVWEIRILVLQEWILTKSKKMKSSYSLCRCCNLFFLQSMKKSLLSISLLSLNGVNGLQRLGCAEFKFNKVNLIDSILLKMPVQSLLLWDCKQWLSLWSSKRLLTSSMSVQKHHEKSNQRLNMHLLTKKELRIAI